MTNVPKKKQSLQSKHWCFTINNPTSSDFPDGFYTGKVYSYVVLGKEIGDTGTPHIQGYFCLINRKRLTAVKKILPRAHLEIMRGTPLEAATYCKKDGNWTEHGTFPLTAAQASSSKLKRDWDGAYDLAVSGKMSDIPRSMLIPYYHAFKRIQQDNPTKPDDRDDTCGIWLHGVTGAGKSHYARAMYPHPFDKPLNKWWDGYKGQANVLLDDIDTSHATWIGPFLKRWADRYSFPAEQKGTTVQIRPQRIIVTSQHRLIDLFQGRMGKALARRFTEIHITDSTRRRNFFPKPVNSDTDSDIEELTQSMESDFDSLDTQNPSQE